MDTSMEERLIQVIRSTLDDDKIEFKPRTKLKDIGVTSFALVQLIFEIEKEFTIHVTNDEIARLKDFSGVIKLIERKTANSNGTQY